MKRRIFGTTVAILLCLGVPFANGAQRGRGGEKPGEKGGEPRGKVGEKPGGEKPGAEKPGSEGKSANKAPGGAWSEGKQSPGKQSAATRDQEAEGKTKSQQPTGAEGAAAGAAASNRNKPSATGADGAAAGAATSNRNKPSATGAEGAAVGAAASNRNNPAATGAEGAAVGAAAANRNQPNVSGAAGTAAGYAAVRNSFDHPNIYNQQWYADHQDAWTASNWNAGTVWTPASMAAISRQNGYANSTPISYGYGDNVTYQNGNVMIDGRNVGTGEAYSQQAADLAWVGQNATTQDDDQWLPLGVFALVRNEDQQPQITLQLAINAKGILRGNYTDIVTDHTLPVHGAVEKATQRAAWTVDNKKGFFMEAGLTNLSSGEASTLIHKFGRTEKWLLVRLPKPDSADIVAVDPDSGR